MVCPNVLVLLALAIGARIQHIDAQSVFLDALDYPVAADFATYYAEGVRKLAGGRFCLPPCSPNANGQFVESKKPEPISDSSLLWNFTAFPAMTPRMSGLYRCFTSTAQSRRTYTLHAPEEFPTPMTPVTTTTSVTYVVPISSGMPQNLEGSGTWILMLLFAAIVICESRRSMDSQPRHIGMEKYTLHLLIAMLIVNLPHYVHCSDCRAVLNCDVGLQADTNYKLYFASGQEIDSLQMETSLPHCYVTTPCPEPPLLTLENNDTMQIVFKSQQGDYRLKWDSTEMPQLNPNHTGGYWCFANSIPSVAMCYINVVVLSSISCTRPEFLPECEVSVSCTVYGFPKPTVLWQGHTVPIITDSNSSYQHGVYEYNSTAVFKPPDNLTNNTSVSISLEVFHNPPISCTEVARDSSIQERCNNASRNVTESIAISYGNRTIENDTCADDVLTSGPITTPSPSPGPTSHGMSQSTTNLQGNTGTTDDGVPGWVIPVAVVGCIVLIVIVIVIVLCLVKSKNNRNTSDTEPPPQPSPSNPAAETEDQYDTFVRNDGRQPQQVADPSADPDHDNTFRHPDQQEAGTGPSARPDTYDHIVLNKNIPADGETFDHLDREQVQAITQGQQPGQQSAAATALSTPQPANPRVDTSYSMVDMSKKSSRPLLV